MSLQKKLLFAAITSFIFVAFFLTAAEWYLNRSYEQWRSAYAKRGDWYGGLTIVSKNPELMWEYRPNAASNKPGVRKIRTNRYGFRDHDFETMDKLPGVYRIAFIGDSITLGYTVDRQRTFVYKFEKYANKGTSDLVVQPMNFGIDGYNINQIFALLASRVLQFKPDKVVYVMCLNDFAFEELSSGGKMRFFKKPDSFLLEAIQRRYKHYLGIDYHTWHFEMNKRLAFDKILEMKQLLLERKVDFQIVLVPIFRFKNSNKSFTDYPLSEIHAEIGQFMKEQHIDFMDLLDAFRKQKKSPWDFSSDIWHPNAQGHDFIARQLLKPVLKEKFSQPVKQPEP